MLRFGSPGAFCSPGAFGEVFFFSRDLAEPSPKKGALCVCVRARGRGGVWKSKHLTRPCVCLHECAAEEGWSAEEKICLLPFQLKWLIKTIEAI